MTQKISNPYQRKSKFQYSHALSPSLSTNSLFAPIISSCPRKKYSTETWYDCKSSNPQLSEKVLYRMQANFYALQSKGQQEQQYQHIEKCLLNSQCKKNPFQKSSLVDLHALSYSQSFYKDSIMHWTDEKNKKNLWAHQSHQTSLQTLGEYSQLRKKQLGLKQKQKFNFYNSSTSNFLKGTGNFGNNTESKVTPQAQPKPLYAFIDKEIKNKTIQNKISQSSQQQIHQSESYLKKSSKNTFGYRRSSQQIPSKITYMDKPFFFIKLDQK